MKRILFSFTFFFAALSLFASIDISRLEPAFWWAGMKNPELQILVYGKEIGQANVSVVTPGISVKNVVKADSPNYLFVYLDLSNAKPGMIKLNFTQGKQKKTVLYELRQRASSPGLHKGFSTSDVLYLIMPDRFANGNPSNDNHKMNCCTVNVDRSKPDSRHGGDLAGLEKHLDYIYDLGFTAIWVNPILENDMPGGAYHGYAITDYYKVDSRLGTNDDFLHLVDSAHNKGLKVIMDMVFNHTGSEHLWMKDKPFNDWYNFGGKFVQTNHAKNSYYDPYASDYDKRSETDGWFVESMPDLNQRNPYLAKYLIQNSIWWIEYAGLDGIRQDTYPYADAKMMSEWNKEVYDEYPDFNIVGEAWYNYTPGVAYWQAGSKLNGKLDSRLKTVMDFTLKLEAQKDFQVETDADNGLSRIYELLGFDYMYNDPNYILTFLDNHDTDRFLPEMPSDLSIFKQAYAFLLTSRGIPQIYYGSEILMNGNKKISDGNVRKDFPGGWPDDKIDAFTKEGRTPLQNEAHDYLQRLLNWRKGNDVIAKGSLKHFYPRNGAYVYLREWQGKRVLVILNGVSHENTIPLEQYSEAIKGATSGKDVITGSTVQLKDSLKLSPRETLILEL